MTRDCKPRAGAPVDDADHAAKTGGNTAEAPSSSSPDVGAPFWRVKALSQMSLAEWESLCDGCGLCCLVKLEDEDTGQVYTTDVACTLMDGDSCRCKDYEHRFERVSDCLKIDLAAVANLTWLPATCAYRLVGEGRDLYWWHHLVSGSTETVHEAGVSIRHRTISEDDIDEADLPERITEWGGEG